MGDSSIETGDVKIGNINSSLEVLCSGISIVFSKHSSKKLAPVAQVDFSERSVYQSTSIYHHFSKILRQCMGNAASEVVNSGRKVGLYFRSCFVNQCLAYTPIKRIRVAQ